MTKIEESLQAFTDALRQRRSVACDRSGTWHCEGWAVRFVRWLIRANDRRIAGVVEAFNRCMEQAERGGSQASLHELIPAAEAVRDYAAGCRGKKSRPHFQSLCLRIVAAAYRSGAVAAVEAPEQARLDEISSLAKNWLLSNRLCKQTELSSQQKKKLIKACRYPSFADLLIRDRGVREEFFKWSVRDNNKVAPFVEFPSLVKRLKSSFLSGRIGRFAGKLLKFERGPGGKDLKLAFEGRFISILDEKKEVELSNRFRLTVGEALNVFKNKNNEEGFLEFFGARGVCNWNTQQMGRFDPSADTVVPISLERDQWWKQLPEFDRVSKNCLMKRLNLSELEEGKWVVSVKASREKGQMDAINAHGYLQVAVPAEDGNYGIYEFGKYALNYPVSMLETASFIGDTVEARVLYPDANSYYSHRQRASTSKAVDPQEGARFMELVRDDIRLAQTGNMVFQFIWENCAYWPQSIMERFLGECPNYFRRKLVESAPTVQPLKVAFHVITAAPRAFHSMMIRVMEILFLTQRKRRVTVEGREIDKSVRKSGFHTTDSIYLPGNLHAQIEKGELPGAIAFGHHPEED